MSEPERSPRQTGAGPDVNLLRQIQTDIRAKTKLSHDPLKAFLVPDDVREIVHPGRIPRLLGLERDSLTAGLVYDVQTSILCALLHSGASECLSEYKNYFFISPDRPRWTNEDLPFHSGSRGFAFLHEFLSLETRHTNLRDIFLEQQYRFCPWVIDIAKEVEEVDIPDSFRLPFERDPQTLGTGFSGTVSLVHISRGCLKDGLSPYNKTTVLACKRNAVRNNFALEAKNLKLLKQSLTSHDRVLIHHALVKHRDSSYVLMPWAKLGDLHQFLACGRQVDDGYEIYDFDARFPNISSEPSNVTPHLIQQCRGISDAVDWLHSKIKLLETGVIYPCTHMDLKPDNILIVDDPRSVVGKWKISDFGLSVVNESSDVITVRDFVSRLSRASEGRRYEGTFTAPEVKLGKLLDQKNVSQSSDIWSLGAIFAVILAFAVGRDSEVDRFRRYRLGHVGEETTDKYELDEFYTFSSSSSTSYLGAGPTIDSFEIRKEVVEYLSNLPRRRPDAETWVQCWANAILELLVIVKENRPTSVRVLELFNRIGKHYDNADPSFECECQKHPSQRIVKQPDQLPTPQDLIVQPYVSDAACETNWPYSRNPSNTPWPSNTTDGNSRRDESPNVSVTTAVRHGILINPAPELASLISFSKSRKLQIRATAIGLSSEQDGVVIAYLDNDKITLKKVFNTSEEIRDYNPTYLHAIGDYKDGWQHLRLSGDYLACWGFTRRDGGHHQIDIRNIREGRPKVIGYHIGAMKSVAVSVTGLFALVFSDRIIIETLKPDESIPDLRIPELNQRFIHATFNKLGNYLYAWAAGRPRESLYVWRVQGRHLILENKLPYHAPNFSDRTKTSLIPFNHIQGCFVVEPNGTTIFGAPISAIAMESNQKYMPQPQTVNLPDLKHAQMFGDHSLIVLENCENGRKESLFKPLRRHRKRLSRLVEFEVDMKSKSVLTDASRILFDLDYTFPHDSMFAVSKDDISILIVVCSKEGEVEIVKFACKQ